MASPAADSHDKFGQARYVVDAADLTTAREMGLLREGVKVESDDSSSADYGVAYDRQNNIADNSFVSQKKRACCKSFAVRCGLQVFVKQSSVKPINSGNNNYKCKKLNGAQVFDRETPLDRLECPFYINAFGQDGEWKITKANFAHNHVKYIGFTEVPCVECSISRPDRAKRNTTQEVEKLTALGKRNAACAQSLNSVSDGQGNPDISKV
ncbi:hypothetical protein PI124_g17079 [Phytophthora idaei]|nr:hypothetical protein PI125_g15073 [Phytophthora idaei]KAG3131705.1 hypothetical protein PI126_g19950 [Phytophthora idaei]KAG3237946.1 hypothetical protein PI124_g17079 [Phytophthora idaei]